MKQKAKWIEWKTDTCPTACQWRWIGNDMQIVDNEPFTVKRCMRRCARNGHDYLRLELENAYRVITGHCWLSHYRGPATLNSDEIVLIKGRAKRLDFRTMIDIHHLNIVDDDRELCLEAFPGSTAHDQQDLLKLIGLVNAITLSPLSRFIRAVFADRDFLTRFLNLPASHRYHHAFAGGLVRHSLECAEIVRHMPFMHDRERELATVAALLHDAGKVLTMRSDKKSAVGYLVDHDSLTLEALAGPLKELDQTWPDAGMALRHIWTCRSVRHWGYRAKMPMVQLVQMADRISSDTDLERQAFSGQEEWKQHAIHREADVRFWRMRPYKESEPHRSGVNDVQAY